MPGPSRFRRMRMSTSCATSRLTPTTTATITSRCQRATGPDFALERKLLPAGEAFLEAVPVADLVLAELPAEEHLLAVPQRGEVDEAGVEVLHLHPELLDRVDSPAQPLGSLLDRVLQGGDLLRPDAAAVARDG